MFVCFKVCFQSVEHDDKLVSQIISPLEKHEASVTMVTCTLSRQVIQQVFISGKNFTYLGSCEVTAAGVYVQQVLIEILT